MADTENHPGLPNDDADLGLEPGPAPGTPRWVKISWIVVAVLVLLFLVLLLSGQGHGPWRHMGPNHGAGPAPATVINLGDTGGHAVTGGGR